MRMTRQWPVQILRLFWLLAGVGLLGLALAALAAFGGALLVIFAGFQGAVWLFEAPGRVLLHLTRPRLPPGEK